VAECRVSLSPLGDLDCSSANDLLRECFVVVGPRHPYGAFLHLQICNSKLYTASFSDWHHPADFEAQCGIGGGRPDVPADLRPGRAVAALRL
jgi:hypothetical protein